MFIALSRFLGGFPFSKSGQFSVLSYGCFILQIIALVCFYLVPVMVDRLEYLSVKNNHHKILFFRQNGSDHRLLFSTIVPCGAPRLL